MNKPIEAGPKSIEFGPLLDRPGLKDTMAKTGPKSAAGPKGWKTGPKGGIIPPPGGPDGPAFYQGPIWNIEGPAIPGDARPRPR